MEVFDPATNTWSTAAPMPTARGGLSAAVVNGKIYAIGGINSGVRLSTVEVYDPATNTWSAAASMLTPREILAAAAVNGKVYAITMGSVEVQCVRPGHQHLDHGGVPAHREFGPGRG